MTKVKALTFKEKQATLEQVFQQYQRAKVKLYCLEQANFYPQIDYAAVRDRSQKYQTGNMISKLNERIENKEELQKVITAFECILDSLSTDSQLIIKKEFMEHASSDWWYSYYAKSTYYRMKTKAMEEMLFYLNI